MKNPFRKGSLVSETTAKITSHLLGDVHFIIKSSADITVRAEAFVVNKLTGRAESSVIEDRHNRTEDTQQLIKETAKIMYDNLSNSFSSPDDDDSARTAYESDLNN